MVMPFLTTSATVALVSLGFWRGDPETRTLYETLLPAKPVGNAFILAYEVSGPLEPFGY